MKRVNFKKVLKCRALRIHFYKIIRIHADNGLKFFAIVLYTVPTILFVSVRPNYNKKRFQTCKIGAIMYYGSRSRIQ